MKAISSMATRHVLADLAAAAEAVGLPAVELESVGGVDAGRRVAAGERVDLVFLADDALRALARDGHVRADTVTPLLLSHVAMAVPAPEDAVAVATGQPAFDDVAALRDALRGARRIGYSTGPSGAALVALIAELGLDDELRDRLVQAPPGIPVARLLRERRVDLGFQQASELVGERGVRLLGALPAAVAIETVFSGAVATAATAPEDAAAVLAAFGDDTAAALIVSHAFDVPGGP